MMRKTIQKTIRKMIRKTIQKTSHRRLCVALLCFGFFGGLCVSLSGALGASWGVRAALAEEPLVLVELFTSQGCSSCPPADRYFSDLAKQKDLAVLAWHVPYWDYIGWRDPFGLRVAERRQRRYARRLGERQIYTPQAIVGGKVHYVGSDKRAVGKGLRSVRRAVEKFSPRLSLRRAEGGRDFSVRLERGEEAKGGSRKGVKFDVMVVLYQAGAETSVERGENRGRRLRDANIVRSVISLGQWDGVNGEEKAFSLPAEDGGFDVVRDGGFVVVAESHVVGEGTTGAARWDFKRGFAPKGS